MWMPIIAEDAHAHGIDIATVAPNMSAETAFFDKATGSIGMDGAGIIAVGTQPHLAKIADTESVIEQHIDRVTTITLAPIIPIPDADTQFRSARRFIYGEQAT